MSNLKFIVSKWKIEESFTSNIVEHEGVSNDIPIIESYPIEESSLEFTKQDDAEAEYDNIDKNVYEARLSFKCPGTFSGTKVLKLSTRIIGPHLVAKHQELIDSIK